MQSHVLRHVCVPMQSHVLRHVCVLKVDNPGWWGGGAVGGLARVQEFYVRTSSAVYDIDN